MRSTRRLLLGVLVVGASALLGCATGAASPSGPGGSGGGADGGQGGHGASAGGAGGSAGSGGASSGGGGGAGGAGATAGAGGAAAGSGGSTGGQGGSGAAGGAGGAPACGDGVVGLGEVCDGAGTTCASLGFSGGDAVCTAACTYDLSACSGCGDGIIQLMFAEQCDFDAQGQPLIAATCQSLGFAASLANPGCFPSCKYDVSPCLCGDGNLDGGEACDAADLGGKTCVTEGFDAGVLACAADCALDTSGCTSCGDGVQDPGEACDGAAPAGQTCVTQGFGSGTLLCSPSCQLDKSLCNPCGNGVLDLGEGCDDGNLAIGDGCSASCQPESCDPDGTYAVINGGPIAYSCCGGLVSVNVTSFLFANNGASIQSSPSNPVAMSGAATTCPSGSFDSSGNLAGGCSETYHLAGSFTGADTWSGTYQVSFSGPDCGCFGGLFGTPCVNQLFAVTAQR